LYQKFVLSTREFRCEILQWWKAEKIETNNINNFESFNLLI